MRFAILTPSLPPYICGLGDHTLNFAKTLRQDGHHVELIACRGEPADNATIIGEDLNWDWIARIKKIIIECAPDVFVLQFTPLAFSSQARGWRKCLTHVWRAVGVELRTCIIVHESYFRAWRYPPSLLKGLIEKKLLLGLVKSSDYVFTASESIVADIKSNSITKPIHILPIGSNIPFVSCDSRKLRKKYGIDDEVIVLTLFGGGNNLYWARHHLKVLQQRLLAENMSHAWLLLGGIQATKLELLGTVINPGRMPLDELSEHLQLTDVFLMPHWTGLNARRGTLMAALEHGLVVVGTKGETSERVWQEIPGVCLVQLSETKSFADTVLNIAKSLNQRVKLGRDNSIQYKKRFCWGVVGREFMKVISTEKPLL